MGLGGPKWMDFGDILAIHAELKAIYDAVGSTTRSYCYRIDPDHFFFQ